MINEPSKKVLNDADWQTIWAVEEKADRLHAKGKLTAAAFGDLWAEALRAAAGHAELLQTLDMLRPRA